MEHSFFYCNGGILKFLFYRSVYVFHFGGISRLGGRRFIRISESNAVKQPVSFGKFQSFEVFGSFGRIGHKACGACQTAGAYAHRPGGKYHILTQQSAVYLRAVVRSIIPMNTTVGALRNIFLKLGSSAAFGFFCLKISLTPFRNSGLSTTRTAQDCLF